VLTYIRCRDVGISAYEITFVMGRYSNLTDLVFSSGFISREWLNGFKRLRCGAFVLFFCFVLLISFYLIGLIRNVKTFASIVGLRWWLLELDSIGEGCGGEMVKV